MVVIPRIPPNCTPTSVRFSVTTPEGDVAVDFGTDCRTFHLEFALTEDGRSARVETQPGQGVPQRDANDEGTLMLSIDGEPPIALLVKGGAVYGEGSDAPFTDKRLAGFFEPLQALAKALPEELRRRVEGVRGRSPEFADDEFWSCVGHYAEAGAELGGTVGFIAGGTVGALAGGVPAPATAILGTVAGAAGGAAGGFLGGVATC